MSKNIKNFLKNPVEPLKSQSSHQKQENSIIERLSVLKLLTEKQSKQLKQHRLEQEGLISEFSSKNEEFYKFALKLQNSNEF